MVSVLVCGGVALDYEGFYVGGGGGVSGVEGEGPGPSFDALDEGV